MKLYECIEVPDSLLTPVWPDSWFIHLAKATKTHTNTHNEPIDFHELKDLLSHKNAVNSTPEGEQLQTANCRISNNVRAHALTSRTSCGTTMRASKKVRTGQWSYIEINKLSTVTWKRAFAQCNKVIKIYHSRPSAGAAYEFYFKWLVVGQTEKQNKNALKCVCRLAYATPHDSDKINGSSRDLKCGQRAHVFALASSQRFIRVTNASN